MMLVQWEGLEGPEDPVAQDWKAGAASADDFAFGFRGRGHD